MCYTATSPPCSRRCPAVHLPVLPGERVDNLLFGALLPSDLQSLIFTDSHTSAKCTNFWQQNELFFAVGLNVGRWIVNSGLIQEACWVYIEWHELSLRLPLHSMSIKYGITTSFHRWRRKSLQHARLAIKLSTKPNNIWWWANVQDTELQRQRCCRVTRTARWEPALEGYHMWVIIFFKYPPDHSTAIKHTAVN